MIKGDETAKSLPACKVAPRTFFGKILDRDDFPGKSAGSTAKIPRAIVGTREMIAASFFTRNRIRLIVRPDVFRYEACYHRFT